MRMAKLLQTGIGRQSRCPRRQQPGHEAGRSDMFALWWAPGTRLSRRSAAYRAALLYQFGFAEAGAEYQVITTETPRHSETIRHGGHGEHGGFPRCLSGSVVNCFESGSEFSRVRSPQSPP